MKTLLRFKAPWIAVICPLLILSGCQNSEASEGSPGAVTSSNPFTQAANPNPPASPVKLIFIHHSCGENWLADDDGGLGQALANNSYFVSDTNYEWGPPDADLGYENIGDHTDIGHWYNWFVGSNSATYLTALYNEFESHSYYTRLTDPDPGRENEIIMFKSCYPNSYLGGNPNDPPTTGDNPLRGQDAWSGDDVHNVANAKGIYNDLLTYFETRQDKLFIVITAPPQMESETDATHAINARAFNDWLVNDWLDDYEYDNVAVFDFYNVLTSNGGSTRTDDPNTNDEGWADGNHHRWLTAQSQVQHSQTVDNNFSAYWGGNGGGSHPTADGNQKATAEFVPLLNVYYNRWQAGGGPNTYTFDAVITPTDATEPVTYDWSPEPASGQGTSRATYQWGTDGVYDIAVEVENCGGTFSDTHTITVGTPLLSNPPPLNAASIRDATAGQTVAFQDGVSPSAGYNGTRDVILANDADDNANLGGLENLETFLGSYEDRRSLMRWDISALPDGVTINGATVELYRYDGYTENSMQVALYRVTRDWVEGSGYDLWPDSSYVPDGATWLTATTTIPWTTPGGDYYAAVVGQTTLPDGMGNGWVRIDATAAVRAWVEGGQSNYGLLLRPQSGDSTYHYYHSREAGTATLRPRLVVTYTTGSGPALTLTAPTGSTSWPVSSTQQIRWNTTGTVSQVNLYYSSDSFVTSDTIASEITNSDAHTWTTPPTPTTSAQVRVESVVSPTTVYHVSDNFTLYDTVSVYLPLVLRNYVPCTHPLTGVSISGPTSGSTAVTASPAATNAALTLTAPTGSTIWPVSSTQQIRWNTTGSVPQVNLAYAIGGVTTTIETNVANAGVYTWTTPPTSTQSARVRVESAVSPTTVYDVSGAFTLYDPSAFTNTIHLPLVLRNYGSSSSGGALVQPGDLVYLGTFRLPDSPGTPDNVGWEWSNWASAATYYPDGDPDGPADGYPGSLFGVGHDHTQYVSEVSIPVPVNSPGNNVNDLNTATTLQGFHDIRGGLFGSMEMPRVGLEYLPPQGAQTSGKLYFAWAPHLNEGATDPSHGWCELNLASPQSAGAWRIDDYWNYVTTDYIFAIPQSWADAYTPGLYLATGRFRDGGQGAQGPSIIAYGPWNEGNPPASDSTLGTTPLLLYTAITDAEQHTMNDYHHSDEWNGAVWLTAGDKSAVLFVGTKGTGDCWYGCADGTDSPPWPDDCDRGWWSSGFVGRMLFYDPADLAAVTQGEMEPYEPQPYATLNADDYLYHIESDQQKYHVGALAFDREQGLLYLFEPLVDNDKPLVHVWRVD